MTGADDNVALLERGLEAFSRGDFDAAVADMHPDVEWHVAFRLPDLPPDKDVYRGPGEIRALWAAFRSVWESLTVTLEEVVQGGERVIVARAHFVGRGSSSGIEVDRTIFYVAEIVDGLLRRLRPFDSEEAALRVAREIDATPG